MISARMAAVRRTWGRWHALLGTHGRACGTQHLVRLKEQITGAASLATLRIWACLSLKNGSNLEQAGCLLRLCLPPGHKYITDLWF
jgi:hypothetical protein